MNFYFKKRFVVLVSLTVVRATWYEIIILHCMYVFRSNACCACWMSWKRVNNNGAARAMPATLATGFFARNVYIGETGFSPTGQMQSRENRVTVSNGRYPLSWQKDDYYELEAIPDRSIALRPFTVRRLRKRETRYVTDTPFVLAADIHLLINDKLCQRYLSCPLIALQKQNTCMISLEIRSKILAAVAKWKWYLCREKKKI